MLKRNFFALTLALAVTSGFTAKAEDKVLFDGSQKLSHAKIVQDPENAKNKVGFMYNAPKGGGLELSTGKNTDWTKYKAVSFKFYSGEKSKDKILIYLDSNNKEKKGSDYYFKKITLDWKGWKTIVIPFSKFSKARKPLGWKNIKDFRVRNKGWNMKPNPKAKYYIDEIKLLEKAPAKK